MPFINMADLNSIQDALMSRDEIQCLAAIAIVTTAKDAIADPALREAAFDQYANDDIEIDDEPATSRADDGTWVNAWVWVPNPDDESEG